jgi:hypothetical protein
MRADLRDARSGPTVFTDLRNGGAGPVLEHLRQAVLFDRT